MSLFKFFRNTLHEITVVKTGNYPNVYSEGNVICNNYSSEHNNGAFSVSSTPTGGIECTQCCKHCVGCTVRYTDESVKGDSVVQYFVKCKCGHNNIFNVWRRIKYVMSGRRVIFKVITNNGIKQIN